MIVTLWGTRGSLAAPGPDTAHYGGNTSCVQIEGEQGSVLVLDGGTGIRRLGMNLPPSLKCIHILLTHLHLDHIQGLGFFRPLDDPEFEVHIWGPASSQSDLRTRLSRYLSPPLFPVHLRDMPCTLLLHDIGQAQFKIDEFSITSDFVCHPGATIGLRIASPGGTIAYMPDHEPALGVKNFPLSSDWTSGYDLAHGADLLIHDAQYSREQYPSRVGWGHSTLEQALEFGKLAEVKQMVLFHHDPAHNDYDLDRLTGAALADVKPDFPAGAAVEGSVFVLRRVSDE